MDLRALIISFLLFSTTAEANDPCYYLLCKFDAGLTTVSGGAIPSFTEMYNLNPASIPTYFSPAGVEIIGTQSGPYDSESHITFAVVKGLKNMGGGLFSSTNNSFYTYNLLQSIQDTNLASVQTTRNLKAYMPTINLAGALGLAVDEIKKYTIPTIGLDLRYNKATKAFDTGYGTSFNSKYASLGFSTLRMKGAAHLHYPSTSLTNINVGAKVKDYHLEYLQIYYRTTDQTLKTLPMFNRPIKIITASGIFGRVTASVAHRTATNILGYDTSLLLLAFQYHFNNGWAASFLHNHIPGTKSLGLQVNF